MKMLAYYPPPYPIDMLYDLARAAARELQYHVQAPDAIIGMAVIAAMAFACQGNVDVRLPTGKVSPLTLYLLAIASSGERKSTIDRLVMRPFREIDPTAYEALAAAVRKARG